MILDDFKRIVESQAPQNLHDRVVTPDEAKAVLVNYQRLSDSHRTTFISLPIDNIIEFSMMKKKGGLKSYVAEVETPKSVVVTPPVVEQRDLPDALDVPDAPTEPVVEAAPEPPKPAPRKKRVVKETTEEKPSAEQTFFTRLIERIEAIKQQPVVVEANVQTTEAHVEKLCEIENAMLHTVTAMAERMENVATTSVESQQVLTEVIAAQRTMMEQLHERQAQIVETQTQLVGALTLLTDKVNALAQAAPVLNPIFNVPPPTVVMQEGKRTKLVERDENGLIKKITEGYESDDEC